HTSAHRPIHSSPTPRSSDVGTYPNAGNPLSVTVDNVAPTVNLTGAASVAEGASYSLTVGGYTDPGTDTPTAVVISWGDGTTTPLTAAQAPALRRRRTSAEPA